MKPLNRNKRFHLNRILHLAVSVILFGGVALAASAQTNSQPAIPDDYGLTATANGANIPTGDVSPVDIVTTIINTLLGILGVILVLLVVYAGFLWMTAAGEEQKISKAKALLGNAVVGLAIILASYAIASFTIKSLLSSTGQSNQSCGQQPPGPCNQGQSLVCLNGSWTCQ